MPETPEPASPRSFYELLADIRKRPAVYLGRKSLQDLHCWLHGYSYARLQAGSELSADEKEFEGFDAFVCDKYDWHDVGGWFAKIAYYHCDDSSAFDEFFHLLDAFQKKRREAAQAHGDNRGT